ncbi:hypothetical protein ACQ33O_09500 [Ferruginibacter sp. SUN002]|uniref:hypothetical protein n=1 Tax=Ferruginibacter sp. SUN002 TaxID=2937789 RepID=UPI003D35DFB4
MQTNNHFIYYPGGGNEGNANTQTTDKIKEELDPNSTNKKEKEPSSFIKKIKDALRDWAEDDQRDLDFDDTRV